MTNSLNDTEDVLAKRTDFYKSVNSVLVILANYPVIL